MSTRTPVLTTRRRELLLPFHLTPMATTITTTTTATATTEDSKANSPTTQDNQDRTLLKAGTTPLRANSRCITSRDPLRRGISTTMITVETALMEAASVRVSLARWLAAAAWMRCSGFKERFLMTLTATTFFLFVPVDSAVHSICSTFMTSLISISRFGFTLAKLSFQQGLGEALFWSVLFCSIWYG